VYMPSPYNALVRKFLKNLEAGLFEEADLAPLLGPESVLHAPTASEANVDHIGVAGFSGYLLGLREAVDSLEFKPQSFELRDRGAVSLVHAVSTHGDVEFVEFIRLIFGLEEGRVKELWLDPGDRASFAKHFS
jgi:hypothetical protein